MYYKIQVNKDINDIRIVTQEEYEEIQQDFPIKILERSVKPFNVHKFNEDSYNNFLAKMRKHQSGALQAIFENVIGQVLLPTGTGKTRVQIATHLSDMVEKTDNNERGVYLIACHRILLCKQLMKEFLDVLVPMEMPFDVLIVNSDNINKAKLSQRFSDLDTNFAKSHEIVSTTIKDDIKLAYDKAQYKNRHLIIVSTYHSFDRLEVIPNISVCTYDESHETTSKDFSENLEVISDKVVKKYFFTATKRIVDGTEGMANEKIYGKEIFSRTPKQMIEAGEIVKPHIHLIECKDVCATQENMLVQTTIDAFKEHSKKVKGHGVKLIGAKMIISTSGTEELFQLHDDIGFQEYCKTNNIDVYAFSSQEGYHHNFEEKTRDHLFDEMELLNTQDEKDVIFLHIDILTEGIDLPTITGVLLFREMNKSKLLQTIGRACRLYKDDRNSLYNGAMSPSEPSKFVKPWAYVIIPTHFKNVGNYNSVKENIKTLYTTYNVTSEDITYPPSYIAEGEEELERINEGEEKDYKNRGYITHHIFESISTELEVELINNFSVEDMF